MNEENRFLFYLKNYSMQLEVFLHCQKEEVYTGKLCEKFKLTPKSLENINKELNYVKSIIRSYEQFRKNDN